MGQVLHGSARTTEAVRRAIQPRQESVRALARRYGVSPTTVQKWHQAHDDARRAPELRAHLQLFVEANDHARRLKTLRGLTPYEHVGQVWTREPDRFRLDPPHHIPGPYT